MWGWIVLVMAAACVAWLAMNPPGGCVIRWRRGRCSIQGRMPSQQQREIERFLAEQFAHVRRLRIDVSHPKPGRRLRVQVRGPVSLGEEQMIRNFLHTLL